MSEQDFAALYTQYRGLVLRAVRDGYRGAPDEESICQQVWITVWAHIADFRGDCSFHSWLFKVARNTARIERRRDAAEMRSRSATQSLDTLLIAPDGTAERFDIPVAPPDLVSVMDAKAKIAGLVNRLPRGYRAVISCRFLSDCSIEETAKFLSISAGAVKSYQHRGLAKLREMLRSN